jgi:folate-dependent phosphoribosylglycinamide formyltransferase PurN
MSLINPIYDPKKAGRRMRVAAFMSGSGTNITRLLEHEKELERREGVSPFKVVFVFSDRSDGKSYGEKIALEYGLPYFSYDIRKFYSLRVIPRSIKTDEGLRARKEFDSVAEKLVKAFDVDLNVMGGYMSYITLGRCVNVHPADLSVCLPDGRRKYVGDNAVWDAIGAGETYLCASTLWTDSGVDTGPLLMVSKRLPVQLPEPLEDLMKDNKYFLKVVDTYQQELKRVGDWKIFPLTIEMIAKGRFALDEDARVYVDGIPVPAGYRAY